MSRTTSEIRGRLLAAVHAEWTRIRCATILERLETVRAENDDPYYDEDGWILGGSGFVRSLVEAERDAIRPPR